MEKRKEKSIKQLPSFSWNVRKVFMHDSIANQLLSFSIIQHGQPNKPKTNSLTCKPTQTELENSHTITLKQSNQDPHSYKQVSQNRAFLWKSSSSSKYSKEKTRERNMGYCPNSDLTRKTRTDPWWKKKRMSKCQTRKDQRNKSKTMIRDLTELSKNQWHNQFK